MSEMNLKSNIGVEESIANWLMAEPLFETSPGGGVNYKDWRRESISEYWNKKYLSCVLCSTLNISDIRFTKFTIIILINAGWEWV